MRNTLIYAVVTSGLKVVFGLLLAVLFTSRIRLKTALRSIVFLPVLVSTVAVGITFGVLMHPSDGLINKTIEFLGGVGPAWLTDPQIALLSVALVDVWKGVGIALVIFIAGIVSIPEEYMEAVRIDGGAWAKFRHVIVPLSRNATFTVIILSLVGGLRSFDLIWTMTGGGPGFTTDVIASAIFKQYQAGFYGLSTAGNVILVHRGQHHHLPVAAVLQPQGARPMTLVRRWWVDGVGLAVAGIVFLVPFAFILVTAGKDQAEASLLDFTWPTEWHFWENRSRSSPLATESWSPRSRTASYSRSPRLRSSSLFPRWSLSFISVGRIG